MPARQKYSAGPLPTFVAVHPASFKRRMGLKNNRVQS